MKLLAIDTSTASGSVAIMEDGQLIGESLIHIKRTHSERLLPTVDHLLKEVSTGLEDVDCFAVTTGPGSFTGLRIGLSTVKGLAWSLERPVVGVSTLEALALNIPYSALSICPIIDARKGEVWAAIYRWGGGGLVAEVKDMAIRPEDLVKRIKEPTIFLGDGIRVISNLQSSIFNSQFAPSHLWHIRASNVGWLGWLRFKEGKVASPEAIQPVYIRPSEAEIKMRTES